MLRLSFSKSSSKPLLNKQILHLAFTPVALSYHLKQSTAKRLNPCWDTVVVWEIRPDLSRANLPFKVNFMCSCSCSKLLSSPAFATWTCASLTSRWMHREQTSTSLSWLSCGACFQSKSSPFLSQKELHPVRGLCF